MACLIKRKEFLKLPKGGRRLKKFGLENQRTWLMWMAEESAGITAHINLEAWISLVGTGSGRKKTVSPNFLSSIFSRDWSSPHPQFHLFLTFTCSSWEQKKTFIIGCACYWFSNANRLSTQFISNPGRYHFLHPPFCPAKLLPGYCFHTSGCIWITTEENFLSTGDCVIPQADDDPVPHPPYGP